MVEHDRCSDVHHSGSNDEGLIHSYRFRTSRLQSQASKIPALGRYQVSTYPSTTQQKLAALLGTQKRDQMLISWRFEIQVVGVGLRGGLQVHTNKSNRRNVLWRQMVKKLYRLSRLTRATTSLLVLTKVLPIGLKDRLCHSVCFEV